MIVTGLTEHYTMRAMARDPQSAIRGPIKSEDGLRAAGCGLRAAGRGLRTADRGLRIAE